MTETIQYRLTLTEEEIRMLLDDLDELISQLCSDTRGTEQQLKKSENPEEHKRLKSSIEFHDKEMDKRRQLWIKLGKKIL